MLAFWALPSKSTLSFVKIFFKLKKSTYTSQFTVDRCACVSICNPSNLAGYMSSPHVVFDILKRSMLPVLVKNVQTTGQAYKGKKKQTKSKISSHGCLYYFIDDYCSFSRTHIWVACVTFSFLAQGNSKYSDRSGSLLPLYSKTKYPLHCPRLELIDWDPLSALNIWCSNWGKKTALFPFRLPKY